ncbi:MAG: glycosyltransferase family 2 protein [Solirubrobacteraceae bacterium]
MAGGHRRATAFARPPVTIIVPFVGSAAALDEVARRFASVLSEDDELFVSYNAPWELPVATPERAVLLWDGRYGSPGAGRNAAAARARGEWLVFSDADCEPHTGWLDGFFATPIGERVGVLAGAVRDVAGGDGLAARVAREIGGLDQRATLSNPYLPYGVTANLAVRGEAFASVGGFAVARRIAEDADLCWRLQRAGWALEHRRRAVVAHRSPETLVELWRQRARNGAAARWLAARYPGAMPKWNLAALARDSVAQLRRGDLALGAAVVSGWWAFELGRRAPPWMGR